MNHKHENLYFRWSSNVKLSEDFSRFTKPENMNITNFDKVTKRLKRRQDRIYGLDSVSTFLRWLIKKIGYSSILK